MAGATDGEIEKLFGQPARIAVGVIEGGTRIRIGLRVHGLHRRQHSIDRRYLDAARLGVGQADITDPIRILADLRRDLLVAAIFCEPPA